MLSSIYVRKLVAALFHRSGATHSIFLFGQRPAAKLPRRFLPRLEALEDRLAPALNIIPVAGAGGAGYSGDAPSPLSAELGFATGVAVDSAGNLFIADAGNNRIREVNATTHIVTIVAGNGTAGATGDGGPPTAAELNFPNGVAVDSQGNLFIADTTNNVIREVNALTGVITTVAGNYSAGYSGDNGQATAARLNTPKGVAVDSQGDLFFADQGNNVIREVNATTHVITTVAGNGTAGYGGDGGAATSTSTELNSPNGVAVDAAGDLFIADTGNNRIREVNAKHFITTVAGNGTQGYSGDNGQPTAAELAQPSSVAVNSKGDILFIADNNNQRIREVHNGAITTFAGNGSAGYNGDGQTTAAELNYPNGLAVDGHSHLFFADTVNNRIREVSGGVITTVVGNGTAGSSGDKGPATSAELHSPHDVALDSAGDLFIADGVNNQILEAALPPSITSVAPATGPASGGTVVTINGANLLGATVVQFGTVAATLFAVNSATQIFAKAPPEAIGVGDITVTTPFGVSSISQPADQFTALGYQLSNDGALYRTGGGAQTSVDQNVDLYSATGSGVFDLEDSGKLYQFSSGGRQLLDVGVATFQVDAGGDAAILESNGALRLLPAGGSLSLSAAATNVRSIAVLSDGGIFYLDNTNTLYQLGNANPMLTGVQSFQADVAGDLYELLTNSNALEENQATVLAPSVSSYQVSRSGVLTYLTSGRKLVQGSFSTTGVSSYAVGPDGTLYYVTSAGLSKLPPQGAATSVDAGVTSFSLASDGMLYELQGTILSQRNSGGLTKLDTGVASIAVADNGALYDLESSGGLLYEHTMDGWSGLLDSGVKQILTARGGELIDLENGGGLYQHSSAGWALRASGVSSVALALDGFRLNPTGGSGQPLPGILSSASSATSLADVLADHTLWQLTGTTWSQLDTGVASTALAGNGLLMDLETTGGLYGNTGNAWETFDTGVISFSVTGNQVFSYGSDGPRQYTLTAGGMAYGLANDGRVTQISPSGNAVLDTTVDSIGVSGNNLLELEDNGQLWMHGVTSGWQLLDVGVATFRTDSNGNAAILESNGALRVYPTGGPVFLTAGATNVQSIALANLTPNSKLYYLDNSNTLWQYGLVNSLLTGVKSFQVDASGNLYELLTNNNTLEENQTTVLASNVSSFQVSSSGVVSYLISTTLNQVSGGNITQVATGVQSYTVGPDGTLYYVTAAGLSKLPPQGAATSVDASVTSFSLASDGTLYELQGTTLYLRNGATRTQLDTGVQSIAVAGNGALYDLESSGGLLYERTVDGWSGLLDRGVQQILTARGGALLDLESNGALYKHTSAGWSAKLAGSVSMMSMSADGFTPMVTIGNGQPTSLAVGVTQQVNNTTILDDLFSDGTLWQDSGGQWILKPLDSGVQQIGLAADGTLVDLETNGKLYSHLGTTWSAALDTGVSSFSIGGNTGNTVTPTDNHGNTPIPV